jgi:hypothetical protein
VYKEVGLDLNLGTGVSSSVYDEDDEDLDPGTLFLFEFLIAVSGGVVGSVSIPVMGSGFLVICAFG